MLIAEEIFFLLLFISFVYLFIYSGAGNAVFNFWVC